jgi:hypothetical protein
MPICIPHRSFLTLVVPERFLQVHRYKHTLLPHLYYAALVSEINLKHALVLTTLVLGNSFT